MPFENDRLSLGTLKIEILGMLSQVSFPSITPCLPILSATILSEAVLCFLSYIKHCCNNLMLFRLFHRKA